MSKKKQHQKFEELDCNEIGCTPGLNESELEEGWWFHYEKHANKKVWKFAVRQDGNTVNFQMWMDGSKPKQQFAKFDSEELAQSNFQTRIANAKKDGYCFVGGKM